MPTLETMESVGDENTDDGKSLWSSLLKEVTNKASIKLPSNRTVIVLGDDECGKTTLIARLQKTEDPKKSFGLEYSFIDVKDEERDDQTKLNVWILDGDPIHSHLLKFSLNADTFGDCMAIIVVSMTEPWNILDSLEKWSEVLSKHIKGLRIPPEILHECQSGLVQQFGDYVEPDVLNPVPSTPSATVNAPLAAVPISNIRRGPHGSIHPATAALLSSTLAPAANTAPQATDQEESEHTQKSEAAAATKETLLDETTLSENLGIPIVVVVTKTDTMNNLEKEEHYTEEHFDFIQMHIRRFCLRYGAALFYVSVKEDKNCDLLNRYLQSRIYGFPFTQTAYVVERDCIFVPIGWDNEKKIGILAENFAQLRSTDAYNDVIRRPPPRKQPSREPESTVPDEQTFLTRLLAGLQREANQSSGVSGGTPATDAALDMATTAASASPRTAVRNKGSPGNIGSPASGASGPGAPGGRASEGVLANFFTSLLNKRPTSGPGSTQPAQTGSPGTTAQSSANLSNKDMQSELERLVKSSKEEMETPKARRQSAAPITSPSAKPEAVESDQKETEEQRRSSIGSPNAEVKDESMKEDTPLANVAATEEGAGS